LLHSENTRILLVNDNKRVCDVVGIILESRGYEVDVASNWDEAIEKSKTNAYNLAALDTGLSDIESKKLLRTLHETCPEMIRIIGTEITRPQDFVDAFSDCAEGYFPKPVEPSRLVSMIEEKLEDQKYARMARGTKQRAHIGSKTKKLL